MAVDVRLDGGPRGGYEGQIQDENHLAILFPGYTPVQAENDPETGAMILTAQWNGDEVQEASYDGVLSPAQANSAYDHPEDQGAATEVTDAEAAQAKEDQQAAPEQAPESQQEESDPETPQAPAQEQPTEEVPADQHAQEPAQQ